MTQPRHLTLAGESAQPTRLGLPATIRACLFDLDGVLARTTELHAAAWKEMFDEFLRERAARRRERFTPFDAGADYYRYVDGKARADGVRSFLEARGIELPAGAPDDESTVETIHGLGNRKNDLVLAMIDKVGVSVYEDSAQYVRAVRAEGLHAAVVSSSANCRNVLEATGIACYFEIVVDGKVALRNHLRGKPAPDTFVAAAAAFGLQPAEAAVFEDARAGVAAGRAGGFGYVVGIDRNGQGEALRAEGADVVVADLTELFRPRAGPAPRRRVSTSS
jgi:beta-phosphoglucomutase family hydrolase